MPSDTTGSPEPSHPLQRRGLGSADGLAWTVQALDGPVPEGLQASLRQGLAATVPGEVHVDLVAAGLVPDPFDGVNEELLAWVGRTGWRFSTRFTWVPDGTQRQELVLEGVDTVGVVRLDGVEVGRVADQHRTHRIDVSGALGEGLHELVVDVEAPVTAAGRLAGEQGARPHVNHHPFNAVRKTASTYGWDWGIDLAGAGLWRPVRVDSWTGARLASVRPLALVDGDDGVLEVHVDLSWSGSGGDPVDVVVEVAGLREQVRAEVGCPAVVVRVHVPGAPLWWPRGHGEQALHEVAVGLRGAEAVLDTWDGRVGFRRVELDTSPDEEGTRFVLRVNGEDVYVRGANWIPGDALLTRMTPERYAAGVADAVDAGMNLLRVWGGGIYEDEAFYRACDEAGVLVWQDFLFACAAYSEEEPLRSEVEAEAREAVARLSRHASLALWNGGNENIWGYVEWGWRVPLAGRSWGGGYYTDLLPRVVAELDPRTPYSAGSPFSYGDYLHPNDPRHGTTHVWDVWNERDYTAYREYRSRFVSEFGFQGPPAWSTLVDAVHDEPLDPHGRQMLVHQKADDGNGKLERGLGEHLPRWRDMDGWHWTTQLNQARAVAFGVEHWRSLAPLNAGVVVWQLNDEWPVVSWSAVDAAGVRKPLWHALRRVLAECLVTVQPRDDGLAVVVHDDAARPWRGELVVTRRGTGPGSPELARQVLDLDVVARGAVTHLLDPGVATPGDPSAEVLHVGAPGDVAAALWYFVEDPRLRVEAPEDALRVAATRTDSGYDVTVEATALVKDLCLFPDRLDPAARVDSGMVTLLAGEQHVFHVVSGELDAPALERSPVLRCANDLL